MSLVCDLVELVRSLVLRHVVLLVSFAGCGFQLGNGAAPDDATPVDAAPDARFDASLDAALDAPIDAPVGATCFAAWLNNTIRFAAPSALTPVNSASFERDPFLTSDELTLYLSSARSPSTTGDTWIATRANRTLPFGVPFCTPRSARAVTRPRPRSSAAGCSRSSAAIKRAVLGVSTSGRPAARRLAHRGAA